MSQEELIEPGFSYFEMQAYMGTTKHMGGLEATQELIELCHISQGAHVLDVGCGVGATACLLAKKYGCRVVGVDLREAMIARSRERAKAEGVEGRVEFRLADAQGLPFEDDLFDAVVCESVAAFIEDKQKVVSECARVTRPGGYVGFNEEIWIKIPPPAELVEFARRTWDIEPDIPTSGDWESYLEGAGLEDITLRTYEFDVRRESSQVSRYSLKDLWRMLYKTLSLYVRSSAFRKYMKGRRYTPGKLFEYLGYGIFVGKK